MPVIKHADEKNLLGLSRAIADLAERARAKQLKPEEVHGGTFTITNPGQFGAQFGMPIINQPQVAILGVGTIEKRPVVVDDAIAIRTMAYLTLGYDHRLVDGAAGDQFMADVKQQIEHFDADLRRGLTPSARVTVRQLEVRRLGLIGYDEALALQRAARRGASRRTRSRSPAAPAASSGHHAWRARATAAARTSSRPTTGSPSSASRCTRPAAAAT